MTLSQTVLWKRVAWKFFIFLFWVAQKKMLSYGVVILGWTIPLNDLNVIWSLRGFYGLVPFSSLCPLTVNQEAYFCNFYHFENWICLILTSTKCHAKCRLFCACKVYLYWPCMCFFFNHRHMNALRVRKWLLLPNSWRRFSSLFPGQQDFWNVW